MIGTSAVLEGRGRWRKKEKVEEKEMTPTATGLKECPRCKGEKITWGFACPGFKYVEMPCEQCKGKGEVPESMTDWIKEGAKLRDDRLAREMTLRKEAKRLGISVTRLSEAERGVIDPATMLDTE